ncbi:MAG: hypothetical protein ACRDHY_12740, partial [Anaerolineales bacterium]
MRLGTALGLVTVSGLLAAFLVARPTPSARAFAVCDDGPSEVDELLTIVSPLPGPLGFGGPAPIELRIHIDEGLAWFPTDSATSEFRWGDGATSPVSSLPCPDGESSYWPSQDIA